jgi:hypothetical protein
MSESPEGQTQRPLSNSDIEADGLATWQVVSRCLVGCAQGSGRSVHEHRAEIDAPAA